MSAEAVGAVAYFDEQVWTAAAGLLAVLAVYAVDTGDTGQSDGYLMYPTWASLSDRQRDAFGTLLSDEDLVPGILMPAMDAVIEVGP